MKVCSVLATTIAVSSAALYSENFDAGWEDRWVQSNKKDDLGKFVASAGKYYNDEAADTGIKTSEDAKFYGFLSKFDSFSNEGKKLYIQFSVKHEQNIDCGGGYVKLFPSGDPAETDLESYNLMFGPDICGPGTRKVHVIFDYNGKQLQNKKSISCESDEASHLYTLIISPDNTYEVQIDGEKKDGGSLYDDFEFLKPKEINDPDVSKPEDWVDETMIDDPEDKKPEDWVDVKQIADPEKPEDWDDEMDGEWEAPMIDNPEYKGEWSPKKISNPAYKGVWEAKKIANPEYVDDDELYKYADFGFIGFDLWQVKGGTIFDNVIITDDVAEADAFLNKWKALSEVEKAKKKEEDDSKKTEEKKADEDDDDDDDKMEDEDM